MRAQPAGAVVDRAHIPVVAVHAQTGITALRIARVLNRTAWVRVAAAGRVQHQGVEGAFSTFSGSLKERQRYCGSESVTNRGTSSRQYGGVQSCPLFSLGIALASFKISSSVTSRPTYHCGGKGEGFSWVPPVCRRLRTYPLTRIWLPSGTPWRRLPPRSNDLIRPAGSNSNVRGDLLPRLIRMPANSIASHFGSYWDWFGCLGADG